MTLVTTSAGTQFNIEASIQYDVKDSDLREAIQLHISQLSEDLDYAKQALYDLGLQPDDTIEKYRTLYLGGQGGAGDRQAEQPVEDAGQGMGNQR